MSNHKTLQEGNQSPLNPQQKELFLSNKVHKKTVRFSDDEYQKIEENLKAHHLKFSEFARAAILKKRIHSKIEVEQIYQMKKIGTNINQIAKAVNANSFEHEVEILEALLAIQKSIQKLHDDS